MSDQHEPDEGTDGEGADAGGRNDDNTWGSVPVLLAFLIVSTGLRFLSHPPVQFEHAVWVSLVGYLLFFNAVTSWRWLLIGTWFWGLFFFLPSLAWLRHIASPAWFGLSGLMAGFSVLFAVLLRGIAPEPGVRQGVVGGLCWVVAEYGRTHFMSGFPYLFLAHSQADVLPLIQVSQFTGAWGVSVLIYWTNASVYSLVNPFFSRRVDGISPLSSRSFHVRVGAGINVLLLGAVLLYGFVRMDHRYAETGPPIGIIQGNVAQSVRRTQSAKKLYRIHRDLAEKLDDRSELIIWPETMYPNPFLVTRSGEVKTNAPERLTDLRERVRADQLIGVHTFKETRTGDPELYNSAWLLEGNGALAQRYFKHHLVPFGEFIPGRSMFPFLDDVVDYIFPYAEGVTWLTHGPSPGESELMRWRGTAFVPLICYEVVFPDEFRTHVKKGASFMVNISNEAWYRNEAELDQMLSIVRYRCVENRVTVVRATNSGISGFLYPSGRQRLLRGAGESVRGFRGTMTGFVRAKGPETLYRRFGDWVPLGAMFVLLLLFTPRLVNVIIEWNSVR